MARSLDAILAEIEPGYAGSRNTINTQISALPAQYEADLSGLNAQLDEANQNILTGARSRGLGFSGIPVGEQAKYAATQFAPAVARLKSDQITRRTTLDEALNSLNRDKQNTAQGIYQKELDRDEAARQFNEQLAAQKEAEARAARAAAGTGYSFGGGDLGAAAPAATPRNRPGTPGDEQWAYNNVMTRISKARSNQELLNDYIATARSARNGNIGDLYKLQIYRAKRPDLFKAKYQWETNYGF